MRHSRLLALLDGDMPAWFIKAFKESAAKVDYGQPYEKGAQDLWDVIVEGFDPEDEAIHIRGEIRKVSDFGGANQ